MPELPEVETIRRQMARVLKGKKITSVETLFAKRLNVSGKKFAETVVGASFKDFRRRAKLLLVDLTNGWTIVVHLKMTGQFLLAPKDRQADKHTHIVFKISGGRQLFFRDVRKFGFMKLFRTSELEDKVLAKENYGPEPLHPSFTFKKFRMCLTGRPKKKIKPLLMDQTCIAGIGNIYADETLWFSKVRPDRTAGSLSEKELRAIYVGAIRSLKDSLRRRGTSSDEYLDLYGKRGQNVPYLKAYGRGREKCGRCRSKIKKVRMNGRGTHYCPKCQK